MRAALVASAVLAVVCCDRPPVAMDAGDGGLDARDRDGSSPDAVPDGAARDTPGPDVPRDTGEPTTWTRIARGLPDWCTLERADHPELIPGVQLVWTPCTERDNCLRTAPLGGDRMARWLSASDGYALGWYVDRRERMHIAIVPLDGGPPVAVFRSDSISARPGCSAWPGDLGEGRVAFSVLLRGTETGAAFFVSPIADAGSIDEPIVDDRTHYELDFPQELYVSSTALLAEVQPVNLLFSVEDGLHIPLFVDDDFSASYGVEHVFGDRVIWTAWGSPSYLARGDANTRGGARYFDQSPWMIADLWTDGVELQWVRFFDEIAPDGTILRRNVELWAAPYAEDPAALTPRRVRAMRGWDFPTGGSDGVWAMATGSGAPVEYYIEIVDLTDGRMRIYDTPALTASAERPLVVTSALVVYPHVSQLIQFDPRLLPYEIE